MWRPRRQLDRVCTLSQGEPAEIKTGTVARRLRCGLIGTAGEHNLIIRFVNDLKVIVSNGFLSAAADQTKQLKRVCRLSAVEDKRVKEVCHAVIGLEIQAVPSRTAGITVDCVFKSGAESLRRIAAVKEQTVDARVVRRTFGDI